MTQHEAEGILSVLKRKKSQERTAIEQKYEMERQKLGEDRKHSEKRIMEYIRDAQLSLIEAKDEAYNARGTEQWKEKNMAMKQMSAILQDFNRDLTELRIWYKDQFRALLEKRDGEFRRLTIEYIKDRERIMDKVENTDKEDQAKYWRNKYYRLKEEVEKLKETA